MSRPLQKGYQPTGTTVKNPTPPSGGPTISYPKPVVPPQGNPGSKQGSSSGGGSR